MIVILERDEAERLQNAIRRLTSWAQHFCHTVDRAGLRLESDFNKVTLPQRLGQAQKSSRSGYGLEFSFCAAAIFKPDCSQNGIT